MLRAFPLTLNEANALVAKLHRHHKPVQGHRFSFGIINDGRVCGACIVGRPTGRKNPQYSWCELTRLVTDGTSNACSFAYGKAARIARELGFARIQTFILDDEPGTSLKAAGWEFDQNNHGGPSKWLNREGRRDDQPIAGKQRWKKEFSENMCHAKKR